MSCSKAGLFVEGQSGIRRSFLVYWKWPSTKVFDRDHRPVSVCEVRQWQVCHRQPSEGLTKKTRYVNSHTEHVESIFMKMNTSYFLNRRLRSIQLNRSVCLFCQNLREFCFCESSLKQVKVAYKGTFTESKVESI